MVVVVLHCFTNSKLIYSKTVTSFSIGMSRAKHSNWFDCRTSRFYVSLNCFYFIFPMFVRPSAYMVFVRWIVLWSENVKSGWRKKKIENRFKSKAVNLHGVHLNESEIKFFVKLCELYWVLKVRNREKKLKTDADTIWINTAQRQFFFFLKWTVWCSVCGCWRGKNYEIKYFKSK